MDDRGRKAVDGMVTEEDNDLHIIVPDYIPIKIERILDSEGRGPGMNMLNPPTTRTLLNLHIIQSVHTRKRNKMWPTRVSV